ncbi:MAG: trigger factor [Candidatus Azobacteroides sp.]|nr:trigger factor [Candidatus Azobacteroides sp.]
MKVSEQKIDNVNSIIKVEVEKNDYQEKVNTSLQQLRKKANIPGFRPGKVPVGLIKKMYGKSVLAEEVNKLISDNLFDYIRSNNLNVLGEPLPNETEQKEIDFETQEDFEFLFDIALAPEVDIKLSKKGDKIPYYTIKVDDEMLDKQVKSYTSRFGQHVSIEEQEVSTKDDLIKGNLTELDEEGNPKEGGVTAEDAVLIPEYVKDEEEKAKFIGIKKGDKITINPHKAHEGHTAELASFLKIDKDMASEVTSDFIFEVTDITRFKEAELSQEIFDQIFGKDVVKSEEEFMAKVKEDLERQLQADSDYKFMLDMHKHLVEKAGILTFPDAFLKRWLLETGKEKTKEDIEKDYPGIIKDLTWQLIKEKLVKDNDLKVEEADLLDMAKKITRMQFANYGINNLPEDMLENYAKEMLSKKESVQNIANNAIEEKLTQFVKEQVSLKNKDVSYDEFNKLFAAEESTAE